MTLTISETDVAKVLTYEQLISAMEKALFEFSAVGSSSPARRYLARRWSLLPLRSHDKRPSLDISFVMGPSSDLNALRCLVHADGKRKERSTVVVVAYSTAKIRA